MNDEVSRYAILNKGQIFNTYKEICEYLKESVLKGDSKKSQLKEWACYFKFKIRQNGSFLIEEVYTNPIIKVDKRVDGNNVVYSNLVQLIFLDYLARNMNGENQLNITRVQLYLLLGLCNDTYVKEFIHPHKQDITHKELIESWKSAYNLTDSDFQKFGKRSYTKLNSIIEKAFKSLDKKAIVSVQDNYIVKEFEPTFNNNRIREDILKQYEENPKMTKQKLDRLCGKFDKTIIRYAYSDEWDIITEARRKALDNLNRAEVGWTREDQEEFFKEFTIELLKETDWCLCYKTQTYSFTEYTIQSGIKLLEKEMEEIKAKRKKLNQLTYDALDKNAIMIYNKNQETALDDLLNNENPFVLKTNYVEAQKIISNLFRGLEDEE